MTRDYRRLEDFIDESELKDLFGELITHTLGKNPNVILIRVKRYKSMILKGE